MESKTNPVILISGVAGVGKTTLVKKILSDWISEKNIMKNIDHYDLVLHTECRNTAIRSFKDMLEQLMPRVARKFKGDDLKKVALAQEILLILDGLDELNSSSALLFDEVLQLKSNYGITVMVTSRPERLEYFKERVSSRKFKIKHIQLVGVPQDKRDELVKKYHSAMTKKYPDTQAIDGLLDYLERTGYRLSNLWELPYNLTLLTILWTFNYMTVSSISTAPELYWEILILYRSKLMERLLCYEATRHLEKTELEIIIESFLYNLAKESLVGLKNDNINLPQEAYERLLDAWSHMNVPIKEMLSAFLKKLPTSSGTIYGFPHKGLQELFAAYYIWMQISEKYQSSDIQKIVKAVDYALKDNAVSVPVTQSILRFTTKALKKEGSKCATKKLQYFDADKVIVDIEKFLTKSNVPEDLSEEIYGLIKERQKINPQEASVSSLDETPTQMTKKKGSGGFKFPSLKTKLKTSRSQETVEATPETSKIRNILEEIEGSSNFEMSKFQNLIISLIGIFHREGQTVANDTKLEALMLLQEAGVRDKDAWLNIMNSVKCDKSVAAFIISKQPTILDGIIELTDSSFFPYMSLIQALEPNKDNFKGIIHIYVKGNMMSDAEDFLNQISIHQFKVNRIVMTENNIDKYTSLLKSLKKPLKDSKAVNVTIDIQRDTSDVMKLMKEIEKHTFNVDRLMLRHDFRCPSIKSTSEDAIVKIFRSCQVVLYWGLLTPKIRIPNTVRDVCIGLADNDAYRLLESYLKTKPPLDKLGLCIGPMVDRSDLRQLNSSKDYQLFIPDITKKKINRAVDIIKALQPIDGKECFSYLYFPRDSLDVSGICKLIERLNGVRVDNSLVFPSSSKPSKAQELNLITGTAINQENSKLQIKWGVGGIDSW